MDNAQSGYCSVEKTGKIKKNLIGEYLSFFSDLYQITMAYAYWKARRIDDRAVFDLFFRKNPFHGEFTIFAGLSECLKFLENFKYSESDIEYLRETLPSNVEEDFFTYLANLTPKDIKIHALQEGSIAFPRWVVKLFKVMKFIKYISPKKDQK